MCRFEFFEMKVAFARRRRNLTQVDREELELFVENNVSVLAEEEKIFTF